MKVLVAYASRHGATAGIAERIAATLTSAGMTADAQPVEEVSDVAAYDAFVIGAATYMFHWLKDAGAFAKRHRDVLQSHPLWLFSSGPLGTDTIDAEGRDVLETSEPKEFHELVETLHPRGTQVFFGAWDPTSPPVGVGERLMKLMPSEKSPLQAGDFRDWAAIDAWANDVATLLRAEPAASR